MIVYEVHCGECGGLIAGPFWGQEEAESVRNEHVSDAHGGDGYWVRVIPTQLTGWEAARLLGWPTGDETLRRKAYGRVISERLRRLGISDPSRIILRAGGVHMVDVAADLYEFTTTADWNDLVEYWRTLRAGDPGGGFRYWAQISFAERFGVTLPDDEIIGRYGPSAWKAARLMNALAVLAEALGHGD